MDRKLRQRQENEVNAIVQEDLSTLDGDDAGLNVTVAPERPRKIIHVEPCGYGNAG